MKWYKLFFILLLLIFLIPFSTADEFLNVTNITIQPTYPVSTSELNCSAVTDYSAGITKANVTINWSINQDYANTQSLIGTILNVANNTQVSNTTTGTLTEGNEWVCTIVISNSTANGGQSNSSLVRVRAESDSRALIFVIVPIFLIFLLIFISKEIDQKTQPYFVVLAIFLAVGLIMVLLFNTYQIAHLELPENNNATAQEAVENVMESTFEHSIWISIFFIGVFLTVMIYVYVESICKKKNLIRYYGNDYYEDEDD